MAKKPKLSKINYYNKKLPQIYKGDIAVDDRGELQFINQLDLSKVKRFYTVQNHTPGFIRAWHGHLKEEKYLTMISGSALVAVIRMIPSSSSGNGYAMRASFQTDGYSNIYALNSSGPRVLYIPGGYAHGFKLLTEDSKIMIFSTATVEESKKDDYRYDANDYKDIFKVIER